MNFEQIKKKYPKAWEKFKDFNLHKRTGCFDKNVEDYIKSWKFESLSGWLFRFFDEQNIVILIDAMSSKRFEGHYIWGYKIFRYWSDKSPAHDSHAEILQIREEAEQAAFTKAFEILEKK